VFLLDVRGVAQGIGRGGANRRAGTRRRCNRRVLGWLAGDRNNLAVSARKHCAGAHAW
jgi:hypothetical protein